MRAFTVLAGAMALGAMSLANADGQARPPRGQGFNNYFGGPNDYYTPPMYHGNPLYDGRVTFARIKYRGFEHFGREGPGWSHDYPDAEENFVKIVRDISAIRPFVEDGPIVGSAIVTLDDPMLFKYPVAYMSEPGGWHPNEKEAAGLRGYLLKGGFIIFDDFREGWGRDYDWTQLRQNMAMVLPGAKWVQLTGKEPIFNCFFNVDLEKAINPTSAYGVRPPTYWGVYQDNDPKKRLIAIGNVDNDIGESWQWSASGFIPISASNETYKIGVNYWIYALTH
ncbi:MAG: DUF4159 domain-containing protein [Thermoanaerobaculia bacterium]